MHLSIEIVNRSKATCTGNKVQMVLVYDTNTGHLLAKAPHVLLHIPMGKPHQHFDKNNCLFFLIKNAMIFFILLFIYFLITIDHLF